MSTKDSAQNVIESYRKRQQMGPFVIGGLAVVLIIVGIVVLVVWLTGEDRPAVALFASKTPTATTTATPTATIPTPTPTSTSTPTQTPTITETPTRAGPTEYTVQELDTCWDIAQDFKVDVNVLVAINNFEAGTCPIVPGDKIWIPTSEQQLDTPTPLPTNFKGEITYTVQTGDTLDIIADQFQSTVDAIMEENDLEDANKINVGDKLIIPVNIATRVPTRAPTSTKGPGTQTAAAQTQAVTATSPGPGTPVPSATR
jgi:LysM repeat protein